MKKRENEKKERRSNKKEEKREKKRVLMTKELKKGAKMEEKEHADVTKGKMSVARKIAKAHLKEHANYYEELPKCEAKMGKKMKRRKGK